MVQALYWSARVAPQYYEYRTAYAGVQLLRNRLSSAAYHVATAQVAELETALDPNGTPTAAALGHLCPVPDASVV